MKPYTKPTLTKNDSCANKGHHSDETVTTLQEHYTLSINGLQEKNKGVINEIQFNKIPVSLDTVISFKFFSKRIFFKILFFSSFYGLVPDHMGVL